MRPDLFTYTFKVTEMDDILSQEHWTELQGRLKQQFPELTDADLQYHESMEQDMLRMVGFRLHMNIDEMRGIFVGH